MIPAPNLILSGYCTDARMFFNRTTGLMSTDARIYDRLIRNLVNYELWPTLDGLWIFAAPDSSNALLNLKSSSFTATLVNGGTPLTFTANRGFNNPGTTSNASYIETNYNAVTNGINFTQNSCHASAWVAFSNTTSAGFHLLGNGTAGTVDVNILNKFDVAGGGIYRCNDAVGVANVANADRQGHYITNRPSSTTRTAYRNAVDQAVGNSNSTAHTNATFHVLHATGSTIYNNLDTAAMFSVGGSLSPNDARNFYNIFRIYMTAKGVP